MADTQHDIGRRRANVAGASSSLKAVSLARRADWLSNTARILTETGSQAAGELSQSTGLSAPMVEWGLQTTLDTVTSPVLQTLGTRALASGLSPRDWLPLILAGNLFTASVRGVFVPLLLGVPVLAKASSRELLFPELLRDALRSADAELGTAFDLVSFRGGDVELERELVRDASAIAVYGGDDTVADVKSRHRGARILAHGHGLSLAFIGRASLASGDTMESFALDVAAYDQRGCLSPQAIFVEASPNDAEVLAARLCEALERCAATLPRGPLPLDAGAAQAQWRGLAEVRGRLVEGDECAVALVQQDALQWSPGYRNVSVVPVESLQDAIDSWADLGGTLKCVGVDDASLGVVASALSSSGPLSAYACPIGTMQTPAFDAPVDGNPPWDGLLA